MDPETQQLENEIKEKERKIAVTTEQKMGLGVKVLLTAIVIGSALAGVYLALTLSQ